MDQDGNYTSIDDDFNSAAGMAAMKGMQKLAQSSCYDSNADIFTDAAVVITGIWNANAAADHFGENLGATDLPSFEVDGKSYHLGSYTGNKLMGVKPQTDAKKGAVLSLLAQYLTNEQCQLERYNQYQWGPSNKNAQASESVQSNISLAALAKQGEYGIPQGQIHGSWWDIAKVLGADAKKAAVLSQLAQFLTNEENQMKRYEKYQWGPSNKNAQASESVQSNASLAALAKQNEHGQPQGQIHGSWWDIAKLLGAQAKAATSDEDLQAALNDYTATIDGLFQMTEEQKNAWGVIGGICGTSWDTDFPMTETAPGTYVSEVLELHAGEEFKVRQGASWDVNFGVEFNGANIVVEADGKYQVKLVWDGAQGGTVTLVPAE